MVNGAEVGLGTLLQRVVQLPPPRVVFAGARALVVSWDAGPENAPVELHLHRGEGGSGLALCAPAGAVGNEAVANHRIGGLQPDTLLSLRLVAVCATAVGDDGGNVSSEWVTARTRPSASAHDRPMCRRVSRGDGTSCSASPDAFGRLRGQVLSSTGGRLDCPTGLWMPSELLHGGLNAAVANFRCGDCCLAPTQHEDFGPAQELPKILPARRQQQLATMDPSPEPEQPMLTRDEYIQEFCTWDSSRPSWASLYTTHGSPGCGDADDTGVMAVVATSDIHIDFPDNQRCKHNCNQSTGSVVRLPACLPACLPVISLNDTLTLCRAGPARTVAWWGRAMCFDCGW
jgi:hypothetical protein